MQWKNNVNQSRKLSLEEFTVPEPFFKTQEIGDSGTLKIATFTGHTINGVRLLKEVTVDTSGQWQLQIGGKVISHESLSLCNVLAKDVDRLSLILTTIKEAPVCEGAAIEGGIDPENCGDINTWQCDDPEDSGSKRSLRSNTCMGVLGILSTCPTCTHCSVALYSLKQKQHSEQKDDFDRSVKLAANCQFPIRKLGNYLRNILSEA